MEISRRLRNLLMDHLAGASVLREIESEFEAADIAPGAPPEETGLALGQRRTLVQTYYNGLDFSAPADVRKFLNVLSVFMANLERQLTTAAPWASQTDDSYKATRSAMGDMAKSLERDPQLESLLASRKVELGIGYDTGRKLGAELAFTHRIDLGRGRGIGI